MVATSVSVPACDQERHREVVANGDKWLGIAAKVSRMAWVRVVRMRSSTGE